MIQEKKEPELRFTEFEKEWEEKSLSKVLKLTLREVLKPESAFLSIGVRSHMKGTFHKPDSDPKQIALERLYLVKKDDLILNITFAWEGAIAIAKPEDDDGFVSHRFPTFTFKERESSPEYFQQIFLLRKFKALLSLISPGGAGRNRVLSKNEFLKQKWIFPSFEEQQKIASFLGTVDEKLAKLRQQKELLGKYKKGLMQCIFSQELRFRSDDGGEFPEWEEKRLGEVATFLKGAIISKGDLVRNGKTPCILYGELYTTYREIIKKVVSATDLDENLLVFSQTNDLIIPSSGETELEIARSSCVMEPNVAYGGDLNIIRGDFSGIFMAYYLNFAKIKDISRVAQGISVVHLYSSQLKELGIEIPHPDEQKKIADCLGALDEKIDAVGRKIAAMDAFKKGLLQRMFL